MNVAPKPKLVKAYLEKTDKGVLLAWWEDPRSRTPSMKYPVLEFVFVNIVEKFRYENMQVLVNWCGKEELLQPTQTPAYQYG
jgi:hypothetical protein